MTAEARAPAKAMAGMTAAMLTALVAAVTLQAPETARHEGERLRAYRDTGGVWTICNGDTTNVRPGQVATHAECRRRLNDRLGEHMRAVLVDTPQLSAHVGVLRQAGDFHYNAGGRHWRASPMRVHFRAGRWRQGCEAFRGYIDMGRVDRPYPRYRCRQTRSHVWYCQLPGLVARREAERAQCLASL